MDEGRVSGTGSRPLQANGEVQEGRKFSEGCQKGHLLEGSQEDITQKHQGYN